MRGGTIKRKEVRWERKGIVSKGERLERGGSGRQDLKERLNLWERWMEI